MNPRTLTASLFALSATAVLVACGEVIPEGQGTITQPPNATDAEAPPPPSFTADAGDDSGTVVPKRLVEQRNAFGSLDPTNLALDGDFEFSGRSGQMPWLNFSQTSTQGTLDFETGGKCASGMRCAKITKDVTLFGWIISPKAGQSIDLTAKTRQLVGTPKKASDSSPCPEPKLNVYLIDIDNPNAPQKLAIASDQAPVNGFCTYHGVFDAMPLASPGLYVENEMKDATDVILLDAVVAKAVPAATPHSGHLPVTQSAAQRAQLVNVAAWIRRHRFGGEHVTTQTK